MKNTVIQAARIAKMEVMDRLIEMSETDAEREQMERSKSQLAAMTDAEFMRYHGVRV